MSQLIVELLFRILVIVGAFTVGHLIGYHRGIKKAFKFSAENIDEIYDQHYDAEELYKVWLDQV